MEYLIIILLQLAGIGLHVMQKVMQLDDMHPEKGPAEVFKIFMKKDWDTLIISGIVLFLNVLVHFIIAREAPHIAQVGSYNLYTYAIAFVLGYAGQRLVYKALGKAEKTLNDKIDNYK